MATCKQCEKEMGFADRMNAKSYGGLCVSCTTSNQSRDAQIATGTTPEEVEANRQIQAKIDAEQAKIDSEIDAVMLTTETAPNLNITKRIEIVTAECAYGMNIFKDLFADVRNIVGGRSKAVQTTMRDARRTALYELKKEAYEVGANAVVGVDLDYVELSAHSTMVMLVASGTAVVIED